VSVYRKQCRLHGCIIYGGDYGKTGGWLRWEVRYLNEYWLPFFVWAGREMMSDWILGLGAFVMFFIYDWNRVFVKKRWMNPLFAMGNVCLALVAVRLILEALSLLFGEAGTGLALVLWLCLAAVCLAGLIYTLYFALPFDSTYCREADRHKACRTGIYGWCRHPGIWWFFGCFFCLGMSAGAGERMALCLVLSFLNLLYAWYQDRYIFVKEFSDYEDYRRSVPFLLPKMKKGR